MPEGIGYPNTPVGRSLKKSAAKKGKKRPKITGSIEPSTRGLRKRLVK